MYVLASQIPILAATPCVAQKTTDVATQLSVGLIRIALKRVAAWSVTVLKLPVNISTRTVLAFSPKRGIATQMAMIRVEIPVPASNADAAMTA
jgi:hypothetical protein